MIYFADLHIHSKYSRATSKDCNLVELSRWAARKGIRVLATGDCTHPAWSSEIKEMLVEAGDGLFRLKDQFIPEMESLPGGFGPGDVRFVLNVEISSIYKKNGATRKVHNLVFLPDLDAMNRFNQTLDRIGNIKSDGRPILGLDSKLLLEIALETTDQSFVVPAHVWTPWFSLLGSRSGFDSVEECFEELTPHIFALETGLSSDPEMNHMVGSLDRYTLISNSDTHSPANLGREANIFEGEPGYVTMREAIRCGGGQYPVAKDVGSPLESIGRASMEERARGDGGFIGTIEFFPEEGKYHLDGHRKCSMRLDPEETEKLGGKCPVCGSPVTVGVMNRVMELGERKAGEPPEGAAPFWRMIPLAEIVSQELGVGVKTKKTQGLYMDLLRKLGPELMILWSVSMDEITRKAPGIIAEGISRVRKGGVSIRGGYDGEYGTVELFTPDERHLFSGQGSLVPIERSRGRRTAKRKGTHTTKKRRSAQDGEKSKEGEHHLNEEQLQAVATLDRPVLVKAGPGTGKTRTLAHRVAALVEGTGTDPASITAVTFSRKAAKEMSERIAGLLPAESASRCWVGTFHQLGSRIIGLYEEHGVIENRATILDRDQALAAFKEAARGARMKLSPTGASELFERVGRLKQNLVAPGSEVADEELSQMYGAYEVHLERFRSFDLDDLLVHPVRLMRASPSAAELIRREFARHLLIDEFQDVNRAQYEMVRLLARPEGDGLFVIGDPDQAIYGFRGADRRFFGRFAQDYPAARQVFLKRNYRSQEPIVAASESLLKRPEETESLQAHRRGDGKIKIARFPSPTAEGIFITRSIESMLGGSSFLSLDAGTVSGVTERSLGFEDFAVLYRLNAVGDVLEETFRTAGIPYQRARKVSPEEEAEAHDPRAEAVTLMTIHAAKGLEFPVVFVAGCEDGIIPYTVHHRGDSAEIDIDEERRLLYVAMTRAEDDLFLTSSRRRTLYGKSIDALPSRFLGLIDPALVEYLKPFADERPKRDPGPVQYDLFQ